MRRSISVLTVAFSTLAFIETTFAQQADTPARIGLLRSSPPPAANLAAFHQGMRERGHIQGKTYVIVPGWRNPGEKRIKDNVLAKRLVEKGVDLIVTVGRRMTYAASQATRSTPIVMASAADPVRARLVKSLAEPGGNITGMSAAAVPAMMKGIEILKQLVPGIRRIAAFHRNLGKGKRATVFTEADAKLGKALGVEIKRYRLWGDEDFDVLFQRLAEEGFDALSFRSGSRYTKAQRRKMSAAALQAKLPNVSTLDGMVKVGGLLSVGTSRPWLFRRAAAYVALILKGVKPGALPVEQPTRFYVTINLKAAKALGISVPISVLLRADEVIQ